MDRRFTASLALALGLFTMGAGAQESALEGTRASSRAAPLDPAASLAYGVALRRAGQVVEATRELQRGERLPGGGRGEVGVALRYELARAAIDQRDFQGAMASCKSAGSIAGGAPEGHACAAEAHLLRRRASEALLETALALAGGAHVYDAKIAEARSLDLQMEDAKAEASFREALAWRPESPEGHLGLGRLLVRMDRRDEGVAELRRAVALDPRGPVAAYELAIALPPGDEAASLLGRAVEERPNYALALLRLAETDLDLGRRGPARADADAAMKANPEEPSALIVSGRVALDEGKPDQALSLGQRALGFLSNSARAKLLVADANAAKGEIDLAVEAYQSAYGLDPSDPTALVRASQACHAQGRDTSARAFAERAVHEFPTVGPAWVALGDALASDGEPGRARVAYETALRSGGAVDAAAVNARVAGLATP